MRLMLIATLAIVMVMLLSAPAIAAGLNSDTNLRSDANKLLPQPVAAPVDPLSAPIIADKKRISQLNDKLNADSVTATITRPVIVPDQSVIAADKAALEEAKKQLEKDQQACLDTIKAQNTDATAVPDTARCQ